MIVCGLHSFFSSIFVYKTKKKNKQNQTEGEQIPYLKLNNAKTKIVCILASFSTPVTSKRKLIFNMTICKKNIFKT